MALDSRDQPGRRDRTGSRDQMSSRDRMIRAAIELFRERGYAATSFGDVIAASGAPRGSIYHHFPGGKTQLAVDALRRYSTATVRRLRKVAEAGSAPEVVAAFLNAARDELVRADYHRGCPIAGVALDLTAADIALADVVAGALTHWRDVLAEVMVRDGAEPARAHRLAALVVATGEGALLLGRAQRSTRPLDDARDELVALVASAVRT